MWIQVVTILAGFTLLVWSADRFVMGAAATARNLGVSPLIIGLTIVGFGTSAPEILVSVMASLQGNPGLAIGNAIGSNTANIGLVGGLTALCWPLLVNSQTLRREFPVMVAVSTLPLLLIPDQTLSRIDGFILLAAFSAFFYWIIRLGLKTRGHDTIEAQYASEIPADVGPKAAIAWMIIALLVLIGGSKALVWGGENIARTLNISNTVLGITIVAIGTSLPEMAVSLMAARKGEHGMAFGNIIGSNGFNMLAVIGIAAAIQPTTLDAETIKLHFPVMLGFTVAFFFLAYNYSGKIQVNRPTGALLLMSFIAYHGYVAYETF